MSIWTDTELSMINPVETSPDFGAEITIEVSFIPGRAGKTSGAPEDCFPPEPLEFEIMSAKYADGREVPQAILDVLSDSHIPDALSEIAYGVDE